MLTIIAALLAVGPVAAPAKARVPDAMAAIRQGKWRCGWPDPARKTCSSIGRYTLRPDGSYDVRIQGLPGNDGLILSYGAHGRIDRGAVCITVTDADMQRSTYTKAGVTLTGTNLASARERMRDWYAPLLGHEMCDRDPAPNADGISASVGYLDGAANPDLDRPVKWVDAADGYTLGPLPDNLT